MGTNSKRINRIILISTLIFISFFIVNYPNSLKQNYYIYDKNKGIYDPQIKPNGPLTPRGIRITAINDSSNSMVISWYTTDAASDPKVIYSTESTLENNLTVIPTLQNIDGTFIYNAELNSLEPNKTYYYKIRSDFSNEREILNFTTTLPRNTTSLKFMVFGDSRSQREQRSELTNKILEKFDDIDFFIHTGDIVNDGRNQSLWNDYFDDVEDLTKKIPGYYIEGNHEYNNGYMYDNLYLPSNGLNSYFYNFSIGPISFFGLNTHRDPSVQTVWLEEALSNAHQDNETLWKIAYMHEPIFNSRSTRPDRNDLIASWCPLFEEYDVDLVFAGHNHYYERSYPMTYLKQYDNSSSFHFMNPLNPMYFITGGAGAPLYIRDTNPSYAPFYNSTYHFLIVEITIDDIKEETNLTLETWAMPDNYSGIFLIDNITIVKKGAYLEIHSPNTNQLFGKQAPSFNVTVNKVKLKPKWFTLNTTWYSLDEGKTNFLYNGTLGTINQTAWDSIQDGSVRIIFYMNDSIGNLNYSEILIQKDATAPNISIIFPVVNETFSRDAPNFTVIIWDPHLDSMWYSFNESDEKFTFNSNSTISQEEWEKLPNGLFILTFYANDSAGNIAFEEIMIIKYISGSNETENNYTELIGLVIFVIITFTISLISYIYLKMKKIK